MKKNLQSVPLFVCEANVLVRQWHRHHKPTVGGLFAVGVADNGRICGAAIVGRPIARMANDGCTVEVLRVATDGTRNACSFLLTRCWRAAQILGWSRLITYTLPSESGTSLRAAGMNFVGRAGGGSWSRETRPTVDNHPTCEKFKWEFVIDSTARGERA